MRWPPAALPFSRLLENCRTVVSISNLPKEWDTDAKLKSQFESYGTVVRTAIVTNPQGQSKGYGIIEFALPTQAAKAVQAMLQFHDVRDLDTCCSKCRLL